MPTIIDTKDDLARVVRTLGLDVHDLLTSLSDQLLVLDRKQRVIAVAGGSPYDSPRPDDLIGSKIHEPALLRALQGEHVTYEWAISRGRQEVRLSSAVSPLRNASTKIVGLVVVTRNITCLRNEEKRLASSIAEKTKQLLELERGLRQLTDAVESYRKRDGSDQESVPGRTESPLHQLSSREQDVLRLLREGYRPRSIAENLRVSPQTVRNHLKAIFKKTGTHSQEELITLARRSA